LAYLSVIILQGLPHRVKIQGLGTAVRDERVECVHERSGIAHGGQWPGHIAQSSILMGIHLRAERLPEQTQVRSPFLELLTRLVDRRIRQWLVPLQGLQCLGRMVTQQALHLFGA
jgi:hypothetical protein